MNTKDDKTASRDRVLDAALAIVGDSGFSGLKTARIAEAAGMSEANIYRHFSGKNDILIELANKIPKIAFANMRKAILKNHESELATLKTFLSLHMAYIEKHRGLPKIMFSDELHANNEPLRSFMAVELGKVADAITGIVQQGQKNGVIRGDVACANVASMFIGLMQNAVFRWSLSGHVLRLKNEGLKLWTDFEKMIKADEPHKKGNAK